MNGKAEFSPQKCSTSIWLDADMLRVGAMAEKYHVSDTPDASDLLGYENTVDYDRSPLGFTTVHLWLAVLPPLFLETVPMFFR